MIRTHTCGALRATDAGQRAILQGWVHRRRDHGGLIFIAAELGNRFDRIREVISGINVTLGIVSGLIVVVAAVLIVRRRRLRRAELAAAVEGEAE